MKKTIIFVLAAYAMLASAVKIVMVETTTGTIGPTVTLFLCVAIIIWHMLHAFSYIKKKSDVKELYKRNFYSKIYLIPFFILVFLWGMGFVMVPFGFIFLPFIFVIDYLVVLSSSAYGIAGLICQRREKKISSAKELLHIILQLILCLDVISSFYLWYQSTHPEE